MVLPVPVIVYLVGAGKTVYQILKTPAGKKVIERILSSGGRLLKGKPKGSKPTTITAQNVAKVLKDVKAGKGPVGGGRPKGPSRTKPKDGKGPGVGRGNKTRTQEKPSGPASTPKVTKPKPNSGKGGPASKPVASKPKPNSGKGGPASKPNPFGKKTPAQKAAEAAKLKRQADAMKKPNRSSNSGRFDKKGDKTTNVPRTGPKGPTKGFKNPISKKFRDRLNNPKLGGAAKVDNISQDELNVVPFNNSDQKAKVKPKSTTTPKKKKFGVGAAERDAYSKGYKNRKLADLAKEERFYKAGVEALDALEKKKKIPTVKARPGPIKVRPKESDQPKKKMTFGEKFNLERGLNAPTFEFNGKQYTTRYKEESIEKHKKKFKVKGKYPKAKKR